MHNRIGAALFEGLPLYRLLHKDCNNHSMGQKSIFKRWQLWYNQSVSGLDYILLTPSVMGGITYEYEKK